MDATELFKRLQDGGNWERVSDADHILFFQVELSRRTYDVFMFSTMGEGAISFRVRVEAEKLSESQRGHINPYVSQQYMGGPQLGALLVEDGYIDYAYTWMVPTSRKLTLAEMGHEIDSISNSLVAEFNEHCCIIQQILRGEITPEMATVLKNEQSIGSA